MTNPASTLVIDNLIETWRTFIEANDDWQKLVMGVAPKATGCGPVYELGNPLGRSNESLAIADMRGIAYAQPHYHANDEVEIYFVLSGSGRVIVGNEISDVLKGDAVVTASGIVHYALPDKEQGLILAVLNTPPFNLANNIDIYETDSAHRYDHELFCSLTET